MTALEHTGESIEKSFGEVSIVEHLFRGKKGDVSITLKNTPQEYVLRNLLKVGSGFQSHLDIKCNRTPSKFNWVSGNGHSTPKLELTGYPFNGSLFSKEHDNRAHKMMEGPIETVNAFVRTSLIEFFKSDAFVKEIEKLELQINETLAKFLGHSEKRLKIDTSEIPTLGMLSLVLMDRGNVVKSEAISTGETVLLNLIFNLAAVRQESDEILCLDEPDLHMHDDMVAVLVEELSEIAALQECHHYFSHAFN